MAARFPPAQPTNTMQLPRDIQWHYIGALQSNKIKALARVPNLYAVQTLDSPKKAKLLDSCWSGPGPLRVYLQVNTSGEASKHGVKPAEVTDLAQAIRQECPRLQLAGLMMIGSVAAARVASPSGAEFQMLADCRQRLYDELGLSDLELSMGMSSDYIQAVQDADALPPTNLLPS